MREGNEQRNKKEMNSEIERKGRARHGRIPYVYELGVSYLNFLYKFKVNLPHLIHLILLSFRELRLQGYVEEEMLFPTV